MARRRRKSPSRIVLLLLLVGVSYGSYYLGETGTLDDVVAEQVAVPVTKLRRSIEDLWTDLRQVLPDEWLGDWAGERPGAPSSDSVEGWVERVSDGDTVRLSVVGRETITVRLYGIDAPERDQPHGDIAAQALAHKIDGARVTAVRVDTDQYGRLVATLFKDGENINLQMVSEGHAWWYQSYARREQALSDAEQNARTARRGLWTDRNPTEPWVWRQR